jgi:hypothetical protein
MTNLRQPTPARHQLLSKSQMAAKTTRALSHAKSAHATASATNALSHLNQSAMKTVRRAARSDHAVTKKCPAQPLRQP